MREELERRQLATLEACRVAWEEGLDPLALAVAVSLTDLPPWLADGLIVVLHQDPGVKKLVRKAWKRRQRDATDAQRAWEVSLARTILEARRPKTQRRDAQA